MQNETGNSNFNYELACTEVCGQGHFAMRFLVVVDEEDEFEEWMASQKPFAEEHPDLLAKFSLDSQKQLVLENKSEKAEEVKKEL